MRMRMSLMRPDHCNDLQCVWNPKHDPVYSGYFSCLLYYAQFPGQNQTDSQTPGINNSHNKSKLPERHPRPW